MDAWGALRIPKRYSSLATLTASRGPWSGAKEANALIDAVAQAGNNNRNSAAGS